MATPKSLYSYCTIPMVRCSPFVVLIPCVLAVDTLTSQSRIKRVEGWNRFVFQPRCETQVEPSMRSENGKAGKYVLLTPRWRSTSRLISASKQKKHCSHAVRLCSSRCGPKACVHALFLMVSNLPAAAGFDTCVGPFGAID